jgi:hypothetical protein
MRFEGFGAMLEDAVRNEDQKFVDDPAEGGETLQLPEKADHLALLDRQRRRTGSGELESI